MESLKWGSLICTPTTDRPALFGPDKMFVLSLQLKIPRLTFHVQLNYCLLANMSMYITLLLVNSFSFSVTLSNRNT